jgi:uncharacterized membrane protein
MHKLYELIVPTLQEVILYIFGGLALMLAVNASSLWQVVLNSTNTDVATSQTIGLSMKQLVAHFTTLPDAQLVNAVVWGMTAALGLMLATALASFVRSTSEDRHASEATFIEKLVIRLAAGVGLVLLVLLFLFKLLPSWSKTFVDHLGNATDTWSNVPVVLLIVLGVTVCLWALSVLCRLLALRIRVFSNVLE